MLAYSAMLFIEHMREGPKCTGTAAGKNGGRG